MDSLFEQISYFRQLANNYAGQILQSILYYKALMMVQMQHFGIWCQATLTASIDYAIAGAEQAYNAFIYFCTHFPGWAQNAAIWIFQKFIDGFILGYDILCLLVNKLVDLSIVVFNFITDLPRLFTIGMAHLITFLDASYELGKWLTIQFAMHLKTFLTFCYQELLSFIGNIPYYLSQCWKFCCEVAVILKDISIAAINHFFAAVRNHVFPILQKIVDRLIMGIGMVFGISAAIVDMSFDAIGQLLPTLPNAPILVTMLTLIKGALTLGLVGLGSYMCWRACQRLYMAAQNAQLLPANAPVNGRMELPPHLIAEIQKKELSKESSIAKEPIVHLYNYNAQHQAEPRVPEIALERNSERQISLSNNFG